MLKLHINSYANLKKRYLLKTKLKKIWFVLWDGNVSFQRTTIISKRKYWNKKIATIRKIFHAKEFRKLLSVQKRCFIDYYSFIIANTKKYLQSDWLRGVQYWPYLYPVFNIWTLLLNNDKKNQRSISVAEK